MTANLIDQQATVGQSVSYQLPKDFFEDPEDQTVTVKASLSNGDPLPSFVSFEDTTLTFVFYTTNSADVNSYNIKLAGTDGITEVSSTFELKVTANQPP